jgi:hypothetical protein
MAQDTTDQFIAAAIGGGRRKRDLIIDDLRGLFAASGVTVEHLARYLEICPHVKGMDPDTESRLLSSVPLRSLVEVTKDPPESLPTPTSEPGPAKESLHPGFTRRQHDQLRGDLLRIIAQYPGRTSPEIRKLLGLDSSASSKNIIKDAMRMIRESGDALVSGDRRGMRYWPRDEG